MKIIDLQGRIVRTIENGSRDKGLFNTSWDGKDENGHNVASGVYLFRIETSLGQSETGRLVYMK
jgi:flagellar hook assembly protein FlgD